MPFKNKNYFNLDKLSKYGHIMLSCHSVFLLGCYNIFPKNRAICQKIVKIRFGHFTTKKKILLPLSSGWGQALLALSLRK